MANKDSEILPATCDFNDFVSLYLESCEPFSVIYPEPELYPCINLDEPNLLKTDALTSPYDSTVVSGSSDYRDNDGKFSGNEIHEVKRLSNRRSTRKSSLYKKKDTKLTARKSKRYFGKRPTLDLLAADVGRGQRSNLVRYARPSAWGLVDTIDKIFKQNAEMYVDAKGRAGRKEGKSITDSVSRSIQTSQVDSRAVNKGSLVVKLKIGAKAIQNCHFNTIPDLEKDLDSYRDVKLEASMLQRDIKDNYEKQVSRASNENLHKHLASSKLSVSNVLHTERERSEIPKMKGIGNSVEISCLDPGTSPDTEVVNVIPHVQVSGNTTEGIRVPSKLSITHQSDDCYVGSGIPSPEIVNDVLSFEASMPITTGIASCNASSREACPVEPVATLQETEVGVSIDMLTVESVTKAEHSIAGIESVDLRFSCQHFYKSSKSKSSVNKNRTNCRQKGSPAKSTAKGNAKEKSGRNLAYRDTETHPVTGSHEMNDARGLEEDTRRTVEPIFTVMSSEGESRQGPPPSAWVCCDDCHKWRRISATLADVIESTECRWICKENMDKAFADCSIPQEKSNADINEELELSEASCEEDACNTWLNSNKLVQKQPADPLQPSWKLIKTNMFLHRNRKNQPIDEIMVCHCKPPVGGHMGCRDECLNRMLNIECVKGTCPCGDFCSNQQFQKRKYSKMKYFPSGKKGYGLQLLEDIPKGRFLIEYVGEVLDMPAYEARQRDYASQGHEHFYFMTLNGSEVIDACAKGNLGRFINHSCEPNCRTEKWMVNGEVCIGFFAIRDIKKGEELTFDYNYVRIFGAAAKKCVCGSSRCRGVIGGDPQNDEIVVLSESDTEYPKPAMFYEKSNCKLDDILPVTQTAESSFINNVESDQSPDSLFVTDEKIDDSAILIESTEREVSQERSSSATSESESKKEHTEGLFPSFVRPLDTSFKGCDMKSEITKQNENRTSVHLVHEDGDPKKKTKAHTNEKKCTLIKEKSFTKLHSSSSALKKEKFKSKQPEIDSKPLVVPEKPKKLVADNLTGRFEAVEEALNSLLTKGGISKRKDAWKGYLTLLCLTANGGNGEGIQSNRDLSMILDALLRTKSRTVLLEIINKNGLQMLHILLKRYREVFNKTPILRKLLKVFEFLAETKILALENILKPSLPGVESFKDSILSFTEHEDKEVHQIARHFRDRYIPWSARRVNRAERDTEKREFQQNSNLKSFVLQQRRNFEVAADNCIKQSISGAEGPPASCLSTDGTKTRKRKSRWDQPGDVEPPSKRKFWSNINFGGSQQKQTNDGKMDADGDALGFSSPVNHQLLPSNPSTSTQTVKGQPQGRYSSRLPTAFGVPCSLLKNVGTPKAAGAVSWIVAPGMTFLPFPPLPVYPRDNSLSHVKEQSWRICNFQRDRNANTLGKRYFRQQKWNYSRPGHHNKYGPAGFGGSSQNRNQR